MNNVGKVISLYLHYNKLSLRAFADKASKINKKIGNNFSLSHSAIDKITKNKSKTSVESFEYLANALGITIEELLLLSGYIISKNIRKNTFKKLASKLNIPYEEILKIAGYSENDLVSESTKPIDLKKTIYENNINIDGHVLDEREKEFIVEGISFLNRILKERH